MIFKNSKIPEKSVPGPNYYANPDKLAQLTTKKFKMSKEKRMTLWDEIQEEEKLKKGPADYENDYKLKKTKIYGFYNEKQPKGQFLNEVTYLSH